MTGQQARHSPTIEEFVASMDRDPLATLQELRDDGAPFVDIQTESDRRITVAFDPELIAATLAHGTRTHRELLRQQVGGGLFVAATSDRWRRRRALLRPFFGTRASRDHVRVVVDAVEDVVKRHLAPGCGREIDLAHAMQRVSVHVILRLLTPTLRGEELDRLAEDLYEVVEHLDRVLFDPDAIEDETNASFVQARDRVHEFIASRSVKDDAPEHGCQGVLDGLVRAVEPMRGCTRADASVSREDEEADDDPDLIVREETMSICVAGVETMGALLTWILWYLGQQPEVRYACVRESDAAARAGVSDDELVAAMPHTRAVVQETLRLRPPAWALRRVLDRTVEAGGGTFGPGDTIIFSSWVTHRDPLLWERPEEFDPGRFLDGRPSWKQYFPFAAGPHRCLGQEFSLLEATLATGILLRTFETSFATGPSAHRLRPAIALTLDPAPRATLRARVGDGTIGGVE
jgi:cytochrome P450